MKTRSFIIGLALIVLLAGARAVRAETMPWSYDFNDLTVGTIVGQDGWATFPGTWWDFDVASVAGANGSMSNAARTAASTSTFSTGNYRAWGTPMIFTGADTTVTQAFQFCRDETDDDDLQIVSAGAAFSGLVEWRMLFGTDAGKFHIRHGEGYVYHGSDVASEHWYDVKLDMDFSTETVTLSYRDLTEGDTSWTADSLLTDMPMLTTVKTLTGLSIRGRTGGCLDNYRIFSGTDPIPEPGTLALLATGLIGLLCYAWRKRK